MSLAFWTPLAEAELEDILFYIRVDGERPETARRVGQEIHDLADQRAAGQIAGHIHTAAPRGWMYFKHKRWLIFDQPHPEGIEV